MKKIVIAIDGHSSSGKSTMAKALAREIGYIYVDSGAMYRAVTLYALQHGMFAADDNIDAVALERAMADVHIEFRFVEGCDTPQTFLNGQCVEQQIRTLEVSNHVSPIATLPFVREAFVRMQQEMGRKKGIVMDGRDIGTTVFPDAEMKVFMTASVEVRAFRRHRELAQKGEVHTIDEIRANVVERDRIDSTRAVSPLRQAPDAHVLDNSNIPMPEQLDMLKQWYNEAVHCTSNPTPKTSNLIVTLLLLLFSLSMQAQEEVTVYDQGLQQNAVFDVPEGMSSMLDSLYQQYMVREFIAVDPSCQSTASDIDTDTATYIRRLSRLPNVIEMPYNEVVREFIERYTKRSRSSVPYLLSAANFYMPIIEEALEAYQLPLELKYLPVIESALNPQATSRAGAAGLWQLMPQTARSYGLTINSLVDERRDPIKSSYAAAHFLSDLWNVFHDWTLCVAAYNCGAQNVLKAIRRNGGEETDYWKIYSFLPRETRGYVPAFIAANYIMTYYCEHGICPGRFTMPSVTDTIMVSRNVHLDQIVAVCDISADEIRALNPQYRTGVVPGQTSPCAIRLTQPAVGAFISAGDSVYNYRSAELMPNRATVAVDTRSTARTRNNSSQAVTVTVRRGDTLSRIAQRNHTTVSRLRQLNNLRGDNLRIGQRIRVR